MRYVRAGQHVKAGEMRALMPILKDIAWAYKNTNPMGNERYLVLLYICRIQNVVDTSDYRLSDEKLDQLYTSVANLNNVMKVLQGDAAEKGKFLWRTTVKNHMSYHYGEDAEFTNPRITWCFQFEDFVGQVAKLACSCVAGRSLDRVPISIFERMNLLMSIMFTEASENL